MDEVVSEVSYKKCLSTIAHALDEAQIWDVLVDYVEVFTFHQRTSRYSAFQWRAHIGSNQHWSFVGLRPLTLKGPRVLLRSPTWKNML
jgi:hypothetical protein